MFTNHIVPHCTTCSIYDANTSTKMASFKIHRILFCARGKVDTAEARCFAFTSSHGDTQETSIFQCHVFRCQIPEAVSQCQFLLCWDEGVWVTWLEFSFGGILYFWYFNFLLDLCYKFICLRFFLWSFKVLSVMLLYKLAILLSLLMSNPSPGGTRSNHICGCFSASAKE